MTNMLHESKQILVVDDEPNLRRVLSAQLGREGHEVLVAADGAEALELLRDNHIDLVITDLGLPDGTGIDLMNTLRATYGLRGIALSGYGMDEDVARSHAAGFVSHLTKPVAIAELRRVIASLTPKEK